MAGLPSGRPTQQQVKTHCIILPRVSVVPVLSILFGGGEAFLLFVSIDVWREVHFQIRLSDPIVYSHQKRMESRSGYELAFTSAAPTPSRLGRYKTAAISSDGAQCSDAGR